MSFPRFEFDPYGQDLTGLTEVIHWAAKLGQTVALAENEGDINSARASRIEFEERMSSMPRTTVGDLHIFGDAALKAYIEGYVGIRDYIV